NLPNASGQRYLPLVVEAIETEAANTGLDELVIGPSTLSSFKVRCNNSYRNQFCEKLQADYTWIERNRYDIDGESAGHHFHYRLNKAPVFNNSSIYRRLEVRTVGLNSALLGANTAAGPSTNQAGAAEYNYSGGSATGSDSGMYGHVYTAYEFDSQR